MTQTVTFYRHSGFLIPIEDVTEDFRQAAEDRFSYMFYDEKSCAKCLFLEDRHGENCDNCASYKGGRILAKEVEINGDTYFSLPNGAQSDVEALAREHYPSVKLEVKHGKSKPLSQKIKLLDSVTLFPYQVEALNACLTRRIGVVKSPPRSGKTVIGTALVSRLNSKTLILAAQREWLLQFRETFVGSETAKPMTNAKPEQVKLCRTLDDFASTDVCLATFQQFMSPKGRLLLKKIQSLFKLVLVDEVHTTPAKETSRVLASFNSMYRIGLSGTTERKQPGLYEIVEDLIGPVIYEATVERLKPEIDLIDTGVTIKDPSGGSQAGFTYFVNRLEGHPKRLKLIAKKALEYKEAGHTVLVPLQRRGSILKLVKLINQEDAGVSAVAVPFHGKLNKDARKKTIDAVRSGKIQILVGNIRLLSTGLNIPRASCLFEVTVSSNRPQCIQRTARVLTPMAGKCKPKIVYFLDNSDMMRKTRRSEWWNAVMPEFKPNVSRDKMERLMAWFSNKASRVVENEILRAGI